MTLSQLKYVLAIAKYGSMNSASEHLFVSQPTLTSSVKELEEEIGLAIFTRTRRGVSLTSEGAEFLSYARQVLQQFEVLEDKYKDKANIKRKFSVSAQHYSFVATAFVAMVKHYDTSGFEFAIRETSTSEIISDVKDGRSNIGVLFRSKHNKKVLNKMLKEGEIEFHKLIEAVACVFLSETHPLAKEKAISFDMLEPYPCLSFDQGSESSSYFAEEILSEKNYSRLIRATDRTTFLTLMKELNGYTLCSGIGCGDLLGPGYISIPYLETKENQNILMEVGYIQKKNYIPDEVTEDYLQEIYRILQI